MNVFLWNERARNGHVEATLNHPFPAQVAEYEATREGDVYELTDSDDDGLADDDDDGFDDLKTVVVFEDETRKALKRLNSMRPKMKRRTSFEAALSTALSATDPTERAKVLAAHLSRANADSADADEALTPQDDDRRKRTSGDVYRVAAAAFTTASIFLVATGVDTDTNVVFTGPGTHTVSPFATCKSSARWVLLKCFSSFRQQFVFFIREMRAFGLSN